MKFLQTSTPEVVIRCCLWGIHLQKLFAHINLKWSSEFWKLYKHLLMFCRKAKSPHLFKRGVAFLLDKSSLLMESFQNLNTAKLLPIFQNLMFSNLKLKHQFKREFILYGGSCDKVVSWYIFHATLGSYIIFTIILLHNIHQKISHHSIYLSPKYSPKPIFSLKPSLLSARKVLTRSFLNKSFMPLACPAQEEISSIYHSRSSPAPL